MTVDPLWLQNIDYPARIDRTVFDNLWTEGVFAAAELAVSPSSPAAMTVSVSAGSACIQGDDQPFQGKYLVRSDAVSSLAIGVAPGSGERYDLVVLRVRDQNAGVGTNNDAILEVVAGTPSSTPVDPALPDTAIPLARVRVPAGTGSITAGLIDDLRTLVLANFETIPDGSVSSIKIANGAILDVDINASAGIALTKLGSGSLPSPIVVSSNNFANQIIPSEAVFTINGTLTTGQKQVRYYCETARLIRNVVASVSTPSAGASIIFDVNKNGTTVFTTQSNRPTITASNYYDGSSIPNVTSISAGDYLTVDIDQVGSSIPGADAVVKIVFG